MSANLSIKVKSDREELDGITAAVEAFSVDEAWSSDMLFRINLVIEELVLNIMDYGYDDDEHEIEINLQSNPSVSPSISLMTDAPSTHSTTLPSRISTPPSKSAQSAASESISLAQ